MGRAISSFAESVRVIVSWGYVMRQKKHRTSTDEFETRRLVSAYGHLSGEVGFQNKAIC